MGVDLTRPVGAGPIRALWASDNVVLNSAYATQTRQTLAWLNHEEYEGISVDHAPLVGLDRVMYEPGQPWPFRVWPAETASHGKQFGGDGITEAFYRGKYDFVVALKDALAWLPRFHKSPIPKILYTPVASDPAPPVLFSSVENATEVWCPSMNGVEQLADHGIDSVYMPHFVDSHVFRPIRDDDPVTKAELRQRGVDGPSEPIGPDDYVVGFVGLNRGERKDVARIIEGFATWRDRYDHPEAKIHLHTNKSPDNTGGVDIHQLGMSMGLPPESMLITDQWKWKLGYDTKRMGEWYNLLDCYLGATRGEGFGVPLLEAAACGIPSVATDHAAMSERIVEGENGFLVEPIETETNFMTGRNAIPPVDGIAEALERVYEHDWDAESIRETVIPEFDVGTVIEDRMLPAIREFNANVFGTVEVAA